METQKFKDSPDRVSRKSSILSPYRGVQQEITDLINENAELTEKLKLMHIEVDFRKEEFI